MAGAVWPAAVPALLDADGVAGVAHGPMHVTLDQRVEWHPVVTVSVETSRAEILPRRLFTPSEWAFDSEQESDERGYLLAVAWIDEGG
jgi:hypothetical protein